MSDTTTSAVTPEQQARDMMERIGVDEARAQSFTSGDVVELANLIANEKHLSHAISVCLATHNLTHDADAAMVALRAALLPGHRLRLE